MSDFRHTPHATPAAPPRKPSTADLLRSLARFPRYPSLMTGREFTPGDGTTFTPHGKKVSLPQPLQQNPRNSRNRGTSRRCNAKYSIDEGFAFESKRASCYLPSPLSLLVCFCLHILLPSRVLKDRVSPSLHFFYIPCLSTISHFFPVSFDLQFLIKQFRDSATMENKLEPEKDHIGDNGFDTGNTTTPTNEAVNGNSIGEKDHAAPGSNHLENGLSEELTQQHREYLIARHGRIDLKPLPTMDPADPLNWPAWKV